MHITFAPKTPRQLGFVTFLLLAIARLGAQIPSADDFNPEPTGMNGAVHAIAPQADGKILVGGSFDRLSGMPRNFLGRVHPNGVLDTSFAPEPDWVVNSLAVQPDGRILVAGDFLTISGLASSGLVRLNTNGAADVTFNPQIDGPVYALAIQADGKVLVGGDFTSINGQARARLARFNTNGTLDTAFNPGANGAVWSFALQSDGKIIVGGDFTTLGAQARTNLGRLNSAGTLDTGFNARLDGPAYTMTIQTDGKILVAGDFTTIGVEARAGFGRINTNGTVDVTFDPNADGPILSFALQTDGKILAGGEFNTIGGLARSNLARLHPDGNADAGFDPGADAQVIALALQTDGKLLVGGFLTTLGGQSRPGIGRLNSTDAAVQQLSHAATTATWLRSGSSPEIGRMNFDYTTNGASWISLGAGTRIAGGWQRTGVTLPTNATLRARGQAVSGREGCDWPLEQLTGRLRVLSQPANTTNGFGTVAAFSAHIGGTEPISFQWLSNGVPLVDQGAISGTATPVLTIAQVSKANEAAYRVMASNSFGSVTSVVVNLTVLDPWLIQGPWEGMAEVGDPWSFSVEAAGTPPLRYQWLHDGSAVAGATNLSLDIPSVTSADGGLYSVVVSNAQGVVTSAPALFIALPPPLDESFSALTDGRVHTMAVQADGKVVVGGSFTSIGSKTRNGIGRLNLDGTVDETFNPDVYGAVYSLALQTNGAIVIGGSFSTVSGVARGNLARINPDGSLDAAFNPNANLMVSVVFIQADGKILIGGEFETIGGSDRYYAARLTVTGALDSFNPDPDWFVRMMAAQPDGKILVGGEFGEIAGQSRSGLARLTSAGAADTAFNSALPSDLYGPGIIVNTLAVQADGKVLDSSIRLNTNGTLDVNFYPELDGPVSSIALQADGKILFGGDFFNLNGLPAPRMGRVNANGSSDPSFNPPGLGSSPLLVVQPDGKTLVGVQNGIYRLNATTPAVQTLTYSNSTATWLRSGTAPEVWRTTFEHSADGITWTIFGAGTRIAGGWQRTSVTLPAGRTLRASGQVAGNAFGSGWFVRSYFGRPVFVTQPAGGTNGYLGDVKLSGVAAGSEPLHYWWLKDGVVVTNLPNGSGYTSNTLSLNDVTKAVQGAYRLVVSNSFGSATSAVANLMVQEPAIVYGPFSANSAVGGTAEFSGLAIGTPPIFYQWLNNGLSVPGATSTNVTLSNLAVANAGTVALVASNVHGSVTSAPAYLTVSGAVLESAFSGSVNGGLYAITPQGDGKILLGGAFTTFRSQPRQRIVRVHPDGTPDDSFVGAVSNGYVNSLTLQPDGKILVGGSFTSVNGGARTNLARLNPDGTPDVNFNPGAALSGGGGYVKTIVLQTNGQILIAGYFSVLAGQTRYSIGRLNTNGTLDTAFNAWAGFIFIEPINTLAVQNDGKILVGGAFQHLNDENRLNIGRLNANGTLDTTFDPGADSDVLTLALQSDGKILAGGWFSHIAGQPRQSLARLNPNGTLDTNFNAALGHTSSSSIYINSIAQQADGQIVAGGSFNLMNGLARTFLGRVNTNGAPDTTFNVSLGGIVNAVTVQPDGRVLFARNTAIFRLTNTAPAVEALSFAGTTIDWLRSGTGPEVSHAMFEYSTNGSNWTSLGYGARLTNGWRKTSVSAQPTNGILRARGWVRGSMNSGSGWFAEKLLYRGKPVILANPQSRTNVVGTTALFSVQAGGTEPLSYRWRSNGIVLGNGGKWSGATSNQLTLGDAQLNNAAAYDVVVTNVSGSVTSSVANLTVLLLEGYNSIAAQLLGGGSLQLRYVGIPGSGYVLERAFDLRPPANWIPQRTNSAGADGTLLFTNAPVTSTNNFWRVRSWP